MRVTLARTFYNASGVTARNDPARDESRFAVDRFRRQLRAAIRSGDRLLDVGCNAGRFVFAAEAMWAVATGLDCAAVPLRHARKLVRQRGSKATFVRGGYARLPFAPRSFDVVLLINNIVECRYPEAATLAEQVHRVLKPTGRFCIAMQDAVLRQGRSGPPEGYDPTTGAMPSVYRVGAKMKRCRYDAYFWTVGFLKHLLSPWFRCARAEALPDARFWLVFRPKRATHCRISG